MIEHVRIAMVYIASWQEYQEAAENLYVKSPGKVSSITDATMLNFIMPPDTILCKMEIIRGETRPQDHR